MIKNGKRRDLYDALVQNTKQIVEVKPDLSHRINKTDVVIAIDDLTNQENLKKVSNIIYVTNALSCQKLLNHTDRNQVRDIIDENSSTEYLMKRIKDVMRI